LLTKIRKKSWSLAVIITAKKRVRVIVDESAVGVGKTHNAILTASLHPGRYLFVVERRDSVQEIADRIALASSSIAVVRIMSDEAARGYSVRQEVEALPERYPDGHLIAICTHQAMMMSDLSAFSGWRIIIDEAPAYAARSAVEVRPLVLRRKLLACALLEGVVAGDVDESGAQTRRRRSPAR
jgi:hypothetical protein